MLLPEADTSASRRGINRESPIPGSCIHEPGLFYLLFNSDLHRSPYHTIFLNSFVNSVIKTTAK